MTVRSEDRDGVRVLSLARPPVNGLDFALVRALGTACESAADAPCTALVPPARFSRSGPSQRSVRLIPIAS